MTHTKKLLFSAMSGLALASALSAASAVAAEPGMEQCAGIVKGGKNDCATSKNACHGHVAESSNPEAWIYVPKGTCDRIVGAHLVSVVDPTPANKRKK